jgi:hypothetical protein
VRGECVGPGKAEAISYKSLNGDWVNFPTQPETTAEGTAPQADTDEPDTTGGATSPCATNGDCAPGVNPTQPSYEEGEPTNSFSIYKVLTDPRLDPELNLFNLMQESRTGPVFNETTGEFEYVPNANTVTEYPMQEYAEPPSANNVFNPPPADQPQGPIPSEYEPQPGERLVVGPNGTVIPQAQVSSQEDANNYYLGFNPLPQDTFSYQQTPPAQTPSQGGSSQSQGFLPSIGSELSNFVRNLLSGAW